MNMNTLRTQKGATLIVGLIMLVLITLMVTTSFMLSTSNLRAVGNMQFRDEAIAAANSAIEQIIELDFTTLSATQPYDVDIDQDANTPPYNVLVTVEGCISKTVAPVSTPATFSGVNSGISNTSDFDTVWEFKAVASDPSTGAFVTVLQGMRKRMTSADPNLSKCS